MVTHRASVGPSPHAIVAAITVVPPLPRVEHFTPTSPLRLAPATPPRETREEEVGRGGHAAKREAEEVEGGEVGRGGKGWWRSSAGVAREGKGGRRHQTDREGVAWDRDAEGVRDS